jgi:hypothetical protein
VNRGPIASSPPEAGLIDNDLLSSQLPKPQDVPSILDGVLERLDHYASFQPRPSQVPATSAPGIQDVLSHIPEMLEDPEAYSYDDVNRRLRAERDEAATDALDAREKRKVKRLAAKRQKGLDRLAKLSQEANLQRSLLPNIVSRNQVGRLPGRDVQSSQVAPTSSQSQAQSQRIPGITMTQPERGEFGARPVKKKASGRGKVVRQKGF